MKKRNVIILGLMVALSLESPPLAACPRRGSFERALAIHVGISNTIAIRLGQILADDAESYDKEIVAATIIDFVQHLEYLPEEEDYAIPEGYRGHADWWQTPDETLRKGGGDCEDLAMLCYVMLWSAGIEAIIIETPSHLAVGVNLNAQGTYFVFKGSHYYFVECTNTVPIGDGVPDQGPFALYQP